MSGVGICLAHEDDPSDVQQTSRPPQDNHRDVHLSRSYERFICLMRGFGFVPPNGHCPRNFTSRFFSHLRLFIVLTLILLFNAQLTYRYLQASAKHPTTTIVKLHFLSRLQFQMSLALGMVIFSRRSRKVPAVLSAIVRACEWE
ncbi:hypothetical protein BV898_13614 [Hypsibius exemplaris]|uniref:Uncharacterized protein n=1 Tax=Hypsibius exemplaris TaxID=2072580 RepID=A0A1W0WA98_HYPEX|nr:hypothetical protein BV898_13614 [Hypsibius exemplaris]